MSTHCNAHRTLILVEVLSNGPYEFMGHEQLAHDVVEGDCSGRILSTVSVPVSDAEVGRLLIAHGSDPDFLACGAEEDFEDDGIVPGQADDPNYPGEVKIVTALGTQIRCSEHTEHSEGCDYVRVIDATGAEIGYWTQEEWREAPAEVMGAILGALKTTAAETRLQSASRHPR